MKLVKSQVILVKHKKELSYLDCQSLVEFAVLAGKRGGKAIN